MTDRQDKKSDVTIVMSVFNGSKYLEEQLFSLSLQTYKNWKLLVRNNGSTDGTLKILKKFQEEHTDGRVKIVDTPVVIDPVYKSFMDLVDKADTRYLMLCDADDFWLPNKIELSLKGILEMEKNYGCEVPLLYHTDLTLVDENLSPYSTSMWRSQRLNPKRKSAIQCLMHNHAVGNTFIFNNALQQKVTKRPECIIMHDVYLLIVASLFGAVDFGSKSQLLYRQHSANICGGRTLYNYTTLRAKAEPNKIKQVLEQKWKLAKDVLEIYSSDMQENDIKAFADIASIPSSSWMRKRRLLIKNNAYMNGFIRNVALFTLI